MNFKLNPLREVTIFLSVYAIGAAIFNREQIINLLWHAGATLLFGVVLFKILSLITRKKKSLDDTLISLLIVFLILHPPYTALEITQLATLKPLLYPLIATTLVLATKFFWEWKGMPWFNPAAISLVGLAVITEIFADLERPFISWWGTNFEGWVSLILIVLWMIFGLHKWRKHTIVLSFLAVYALAFIALIVPNLRFDLPWDALQFTYTDATIYFLASIMLIEPKTSPLKRHHQMIYGAVAAVVTIYFIYATLPYPLLAGILAANFYNNGVRFWMLRPHMNALK